MSTKFTLVLQTTPVLDQPTHRIAPSAHSAQDLSLPFEAKPRVVVVVVVVAVT